MYYFKNSLDKAKQKAGQLGKMAKDFASEIIVTENLPMDSLQTQNMKPKSQQLREISPKNDFIEDLNSSPPNLNPINMTNIEEMTNINISQNRIEKKKQKNIPNTLKKEEILISSQENELISENRKLVEKINVLEKKNQDLEVFCQNIQNKYKEENSLTLQIKEKNIEEGKIKEKIAEIIQQNMEELLKVLNLQAIQRFQSLFTNYLESLNIEPGFVELFLSILDDPASKTLLEDQPTIGLDIEKLKIFFQHEQEYETLKSSQIEYEKVLLEINQQLSEKTLEFKRISMELEGNLAQKTQDYKILDDNLQGMINANIELERENQRIFGLLQEKDEKLKVMEEQMKHYEESLLFKNEEFNKTIEKLNILEEEKHVLHKKFDNLEEENSNLKEKDFRNQILQDQNEEIMKGFKGVLLKFSKELSKGLENVDIKEDIKRLESENSSDFSLFIQEVERFLTSINNILCEHSKNQLENLRKTEKEKNDILKTNLSKIQADCREMVKVDKDNKQTIESHKKTIEKLNEENQSLQSSVSIKELKIKDSQKIINDFQENKRSFVEELKSKSKEIDSFKQKLKTLEEEKDIISRNLDKLTEDNKHLELYKREIEEKTFEINNLHITIEENHQEITSLNNGLHNLQVVHEETQQRNELLAKKYDNELKRLRNELEISNRKSEILSELQSNFEDLEKKHSENLNKFKDLERKYKESEQEKSDIKLETNALIKKVKNETLYKENLVDKRVVCKFLVNYFEPSTTYHVKLQILETLSSILCFTSEERIKIGLHKNYLEKQLVKQNSTENLPENLKNKSIEEGETLKDKLLIYLMNEEEDN